MLHVMNRLDHRGHGPIARWSEDAASRAEAAAEFGRHQAMDYTMYDISARPGLTPGEEIGRKLDAFDAEATEILAVPRMVAG
jgi:hypothetical protein